MALMMLPVSACSAAAPPDPLWPAFKAGYVTADGRVLDVEAGVVSHTEGQGWGMLLAEASGDKDAFDRIWGWTEAHLARPDVRLFSWRYNPASPAPIADVNNATDGDVFIAWALMRADRRWPGAAYGAASAEIRRAIAERLIAHIAGRSILLPGLQGFAGQDYVIYNPSYFALPALEDFAAAEPQGPWTALIRDGLYWADKARLGADRLPPDWIRIGADGSGAPAPDRPPRFGFDAIRAPMYLVWGGAGRSPQVEAARRFWSRAEPRAPAPPAWIDLADGTLAPYPLSAGGTAIARLIGSKRTAPTSKAAPERTYYSEVLQRLVTLASTEAKERHVDVP